MKTAKSLIQAFKKELAAVSDAEYRDFSQKITPTAHPILGVRVPVLRSLAKRFFRKGLTELPLSKSSAHEEILAAGMLIAWSSEPIETLARRIDAFLAWTDNWAVCDLFTAELKRVKKETAFFWEYIAPYLTDEREYFVRFACIVLLTYYVRPESIDAVLKRLAAVIHPGYYAQMGTAWAFSICFIHFPEKTFAFLKKGTLSAPVLRLTIRKIRESRAVSSKWKDDLLKQL